jgi:thiosulfate dehydrogenase [quinone] large subunit
VSVLLILAWKTAGWYGLDRWLLPLVGTPWAAGRVRRYRAPPPGMASPPARA